MLKILKEQNKNMYSNSNILSKVDVELVSRSIVRVQKKNGEIPWSYGEKSDPWNHIEAAMGLSIGGYLSEAFQAFLWLKKMQKKDGSWYSLYFDGNPVSYVSETNISAYVAVGVFHYWLITNDYKFLKVMWLTVNRAINFVISLQSNYGFFFWAVDSEKKIDKRALLTGSSSIFMSLKCAIAIAGELGFDQKKWKFALSKLRTAIKYKRFLFDLSKKRFSMDWFYPVLSGSISDDFALSRFRKYWDQFVTNKIGVKCVSDRPWITIAESSELILSLNAVGMKDFAFILFNWICNYRFKDGSFWCGITIPDNLVWPIEKFTWTNAVFLMAIDSIFDITPASGLFSHEWWNINYNI